MLHHLVSHPREETPSPFPCLVLLHGRGSNEQDLFGLVPELPKRNIVVSARAPYPFSFGGFYWYELGEQPARPDVATLNSSLDEVRSFLGELPARYGVDPARTWLLGFSQGALMTGSLLLTSPSLVAGGVMLSGYLPPELDIDQPAVAGKPMFQAHGAYDNVLSVTLGRQARLRLEELGVDLTYHEYPMDHQVVLEELHDLNVWFEAQGLI